MDESGTRWLISGPAVVGGWRNRAAASMVVVVLSAVALVGCGRSTSPDAGASNGSGESVALVTGSGEKVLGAKTFTVSFEDRDASKRAFRERCGEKLTWAAVMDPEHRLAFIRLGDSQQTDVILSADTMFVRSSALHGWTIDRPWLSVPLDDPTNLADVDPSLGVSFGPTFWSSGDKSNPSTAIAAMRDSIAGVRDEGHEPVGGVDTTKLVLDIDPSRSGLWTGGTTSTTAAGSRSGADEERARRERLLPMVESRSGLEGKPLPDDVKGAFIAGDVEPLIALAERTTGTTLKPADRQLVAALASGDIDAILRTAEASTGTTIDPVGRRMLEALTSGPTSGAGVGNLFNAFTEVRATAWVDAAGRLRRLDERVGFSATGSAGSSNSPALLDVRLEFSEFGAPITESVPDEAAVRRVADLSRDDIPLQLSPCNWRIPQGKR